MAGRGRHKAIATCGVHSKVWLHTDHLGGVSAATSSTGTVLSQQRYKPWGEIWSGDVPETTLDFTGQQHDGSGLRICHAPSDGCAPRGAGRVPPRSCARAP